MLRRDILTLNFRRPASRKRAERAGRRFTTIGSFHAAGAITTTPLAALAAAGAALGSAPAAPSPALPDGRLPGGPDRPGLPAEVFPIPSLSFLVNWHIGMLVPAPGSLPILQDSRTASLGGRPACDRAPGSIPPGRALPGPAPRSPLRGLRPSGDDPCRLRSLRSLRAPLANRHNKTNTQQQPTTEQTRPTTRSKASRARRPATILSLS